MSSLPPDCILGIEELDDQHEAILGLLDRALGEPLPARAETWRAVLRRLEEHFVLEDDLMDDAFLGKSIHNREHELLLSRMRPLAYDGEIDDPSLLEVKGWLRDHLKGLDAELAHYLLHRDLWQLRLDSEMEALDRLD